MATLERVLDMQKKNMSDNQIVQALMQEGISPKEVSDALSQAKIKSAVGVENPNQEEMQPSIMKSSSQSDSQNPQYAYTESSQTQQQTPQYTSQPSPQGYPQPPVQQYTQQQYTEQQPVYQEQYTQQQYADPNAGQQQYTQGYGTDLETIRDIAKREIETSITKLRQQVESSVKISLQLNSQIQIIESRLSKTESIIQELQSAIIRKMGEYGEAISGISQEVQETQKSFSKLINPLLDKKRGINNNDSQEEEQETKEEPREQRSSKKEKGFENYLR